VSEVIAASSDPFRYDSVMSEPPVILRELTVGLLDWPAALEGVRIAHVSDLHLRRWNGVAQAAQELLESLDYDLLVATGDFGNFHRHWQRAVELTRRFFQPLRDRGEIFAVLGNHDDARMATAPDVPLTFLRNECRRIELRGAAFTLAGLEQSTRNSECIDAVLGEAVAPSILLAHYPSTVFRLPEAADISLVLSGHTHGGQIRFPGLGCLWCNDKVPRSMARGLHRVRNTAVHVSAGVGVSLPLRVRINCPPEVALLTLVGVRRQHEPRGPTHTTADCGST